jgi:formate hydrogenlyase subunit 4
MFLMLSALDVGSSFEGMGAAREASFTVFIEPALFLLIGSAAVATGQTSFAGLIGHWQASPAFAWMAVPAVAVLLVLLQAESARVPVDDPQTHLELTMVHEVMVLDHSGPDLAAMQYAAALKLTIYAGLIAALLNPVDPLARPALATGVSLALMAAVAVLVGCIESLTARLRMRHVPRYLVAATALAAFGLVASGGLMQRAA